MAPPLPGLRGAGAFSYLLARARQGATAYPGGGVASITTMAGEVAAANIRAAPSGDLVLCPYS